MKVLNHKSNIKLLTQVISFSLASLLTVPAAYAVGPDGKGLQKPIPKYGKQVRVQKQYKKEMPFNGLQARHYQSTPLPDFYMNSVSNNFQSGPKAIFKYGSCINKLKAHMNNFGAKYQYGYEYVDKKGKKFTAGQVFVRFDLYKKNGSKLQTSNAQSINSWNANEYKTATSGTLYFPTKGHYTLKATIIPCKSGNSSASSCATFPEQKNRRNSSSVDVYVNHKC